MTPNFETQWLAARDHESRGDAAAARATYEAILAADPTQAFAWHRLSALASAQGRPRQARAAAVEGARLAVAHRRWRALPRLTQQLLAFDERILVRESIEAADWSHPLVLSQSAVLAQHLWLAEAHAAGLRLAERGLQAAPGSHLLHFVRGSLLQYLGRLDEAVAAFERAIELAPGFADAHWALSQLRKSDPPGLRVPRVRNALASASDAMGRVQLGYALFRELDDAGETGPAWDALATAAGQMRKQLRHSPERERGMLDALRQVFNEPSPGLQAPDGEPGQVPVFIVGMPRTGTTVLERILGNHSQVASAGELNAFGVAMGQALDRDYGAPPGAAQVLAAAGADPATVAAGYQRLGAPWYAGRSHLLDKNPVNVFNAGFIARALPQARILCLVRDPMDACFSNFKALFPGGGYAYSYDLEELAAHWLGFRDLVRHWCAVLPGRFMAVGYEDLVREPERLGREVMAFCGLAYEPGSTDITRNAGPVSSASSAQVRTPIHRGAIGAWRRYERQLEPLRARLREAGEDIG